MDKHEQIALGQFAEQMLNNPAYKAAFDRLERRLFGEFKKTGSSFFGRRKREHLHKKIQVVSEVRQEVEAMVGNGKFLEREEERKERAKHLKGL